LVWSSHWLRAATADMPRRGVTVRQGLSARTVKEAEISSRHDRLPDQLPSSINPGVCSAPVVSDRDRPVRVHSHSCAAGTARKLRLVGRVCQDLEHEVLETRGRILVRLLTDLRQVLSIDVGRPVMSGVVAHRPRSHVPIISAEPQRGSRQVRTSVPSGPR